MPNQAATTMDMPRRYKLRGVMPDRAVFLHSTQTGGGNHFSGQDDAQRDQQQIVKLTEHRDEIGNQIQRTHRIGNDSSEKKFGIERMAIVNANSPQGVRRASTALQTAGHCSAT